MFDHITLNKTPTGWQILADGVDITNQVVGYKIEPGDPGKPHHPPIIWLAFFPDQLHLDSKWREEPEQQPPPPPPFQQGECCASGSCEVCRPTTGWNS